MENNIHQIWVGDKRIPIHIKEYMDGVRDHHKNFNYYFWTDVNLPVLPENLKKIYDHCDHPVAKADLLRMYVVYKFGGIYLDADFKTVDGFDPGITAYNGFFSYDDSYGMSALANGIFGFKKDDPLLKYMIDNITYRYQWLGPNWWAQIICRYLGMDNDKSTVEQLKEALAPMNFKVFHFKDVGNNWFIHDALASWIDGSFWNEKLKTGDYD